MTTLKQAQQEVARLAKKKDFPIGKGDGRFLLYRIDEELDEATEAHMEKPNSSHYAEELTDVLIQTIQAIEAAGYDVEEEFNKKMITNFKREWK